MLSIQAKFQFRLHRAAGADCIYYDIHTYLTSLQQKYLYITCVPHEGTQLTLISPLIL